MRHFKYHATAVAILTGTVSSLACAQSSVTLYGSIDEAIADYSNSGGHSLVAMQSGDNAASYWGLKGKEDLGGGLSAIFTLESSFNITNGALPGDRIFAHAAYVGFASNTYGTVTLGRQFDPTVDLIQPITGDNIAGPAFTTPGDADNNDDTVWVNNSIKYASPTYAGFQYELMYGVSGIAGNASGGQTCSAAAAYNNGGLTLATGYLFSKNDVDGTGASDLTQNNSVTPLYGSTPMFGSRQIVQVAAQYVLGNLTANIRYSNAQYKPYMSYGAFNSTETYNIGATSVQYQFNPHVSGGFAYLYTRSSGDSSATYNNFGVNAIYTLSKRTSFYADVAYSHASGTTFSEDGSAIVAAGGTVGDLSASSSTPSQVVAILGITHKF